MQSEKNHRSKHFLVAAIASAALAAAPARADDTELAFDAETGMTVAAGVVSLVYTPAKVVYALGGGVAAGLAYVMSAGDAEVTEPILTPSLRGDYFVSPAHLRGERPLEFFGREPADATQAAEPPAVASGDGLDGETAPAGAASEYEPAYEPVTPSGEPIAGAAPSIE
jgi:hypothetical protein